MTTFVSFNINGIRARIHQLQMIKNTLDADIIGLQETKVQDKDFPSSLVENLGYQVTYFGQKSYYGVAILSKTAPIFVQKGFLSDGDDDQKRLIHARFDIHGRQIDVINGYFPQGEHQNHQIKYPMKRDFYAKLINYIDTLKQQGREIMVMGDMNVAPSDNDVGIGSHVAKRWQDNGICSFLPEERLWYQALLDTDLTDTYRQHYPDTQEYSWFDYRSRGFDDNPKRGLRIDHILCTPALAKNCLSAGIDYTTRAQEKPSDHAPVWAKFDI